METEFPVLTRGTRVLYTGNNPGRKGWKGEVVDASTGRIPDGKNGHYLNEEYHELSICDDCLQLIANGDTTGNSRCETEEGEAKYIAECEKNWPSNEWYIGLGSIDCEYCGRLARSKDDQIQDCEGWFTHSGCDYCDSNLGGTKYHAVATLRILRRTLTVLEDYAPAVCDECGVRATRRPMGRDYIINHHPDCPEATPAPVPGGEEPF